MTRKSAVSRWMGLDSSKEVPEEGSLPVWNGDTRKRQHLSRFIWIVVGVASFLVFHSEIPADDGFGGYIPLILATLIVACGLLATERYFLRSTTDTKERD